MRPRSAHLALVLCAVTSAASAQDCALRDRKRRTTGTLAPMLRSRGDSYSVRDRAGRQIGTVHRLSSGDYAIRDNAGRTTGTSRRR